jgi:Domain of unknown function (DUF4111)
MDDPRRRISELAHELRQALADSLIALYLFGSIPAGGYREGLSDIDVLAVLVDDIAGAQLPELDAMHAAFASEHPAWVDRIEVAYVSRTVLQSFSEHPQGSIAVISPGEPLHITEPGPGWVLNWHSVLTTGETLFGPEPERVGRAVPPGVFRRVLHGQIAARQSEVRDLSVAAAPAYQRYIVLAVCRALYGLETGEATTKEGAAAWAADRFPEWADVIRHASSSHAATPEPHASAIRFVDFAAGVAARC